MDTTRILFESNSDRDSFLLDWSGVNSIRALKIQRESSAMPDWSISEMQRIHCG